MTTTEIVICVSVGVYALTLVGGILLAMRLQRFALEKEAEKRIALVRQQLRHANAQIDEYEQRYSMFEEVIDTLSNIEKELQEGMGSEDRTRFIKKQLIQVRKRIVPYVEEV